MYVVRPAAEEDIEQLLVLTAKTGLGMTSLPTDKKLLAIKIQNSINSFKIQPTKPGAETYFFVLEDDGKIIGTAAIKAKAGGFEPFYSYEIKKAKHKSDQLNFEKEIPFLQLSLEHDCPSLIGSLFVDPECRSAGAGKLLSLARFLFMTIHRERFENTVIAEMRGVINKEGYSPFWNKIVRHFFDMDYAEADNLSAKDKRFIGDLMPKHPIYIPILDQEVQNVIAEVHDDTKPAMKFLLEEGFVKDGHVDIFDAGPRISAKLDQLLSVVQSEEFLVSDVLAEQEFLKLDTQEAIICNLDIDFRAIKSPILIQGKSVVIAQSSAVALNISEIGKSLRILRL